LVAESGALQEKSSPPRWLLGYSFAPETTQAKVEGLNEWMAHHARQIVIVVATTIGLYLVARGMLGVL
jgi:hypothetical protein